MGLVFVCGTYLCLKKQKGSKMKDNLLFEKKFTEVMRVLLRSENNDEMETDLILNTLVRALTYILTTDSYSKDDAEYNLENFMNECKIIMNKSEELGMCSWQNNENTEH